MRSGAKYGTAVSVHAIAAGLANPVNRIVLRALQGVGGSGIYSCVMGVLREVSPPNTFGQVTGILGIVFALSSVVGPLLGGAIVAHTTWRWIFLLNLPACVVILMLMFFFFPSNTKIEHAKLQRLKKIDYPGVVLSLAGSATLIYALEAGSISQSWSDPAIVACLTSAGYLWIGFAAWEVYLGSSVKSAHIIPIFPVRLVKQRVVGATMLAGFLSGFAFFAVIINIPQRYQIVDGITSTKAGIDLIPLLIMSAFGAGTTGWFCARWAIDWYVLVASCALQIVSLGLLSTLSTTSSSAQAAEYGYEAMLGLGFGSFNTCIILISRSIVHGKDQAVTIGAITQARTLGGVMGLAIAQVVLFNNLLSSLRGKVTENDLRSFFASVDTLDSLPQQKADLITHEYGAGFNAQMRTVMYFTIAAFVVCLFAWRKNAMTFDQTNALRMKQEQEDKENAQKTMLSEAGSQDSAEAVAEIARTNDLEKN